MTLIARINNEVEGDEISAVILDMNDDPWGKNVWLGASNFPMLVLGSDNKGGVTLQHPETEDMYYVQTADLEYIQKEIEIA